MDEIRLPILRQVRPPLIFDEAALAELDEFIKSMQRQISTANSTPVPVSIELSLLDSRVGTLEEFTSSHLRPAYTQDLVREVHVRVGDAARSWKVQLSRKGATFDAPEHSTDSYSILSGLEKWAEGRRMTGFAAVLHFWRGFVALTLGVLLFVYGGRYLTSLETRTTKAGLQQEALNLLEGGIQPDEQPVALELLLKSELAPELVRRPFSISRMEILIAMALLATAIAGFFLPTFEIAIGKGRARIERYKRFSAILKAIPAVWIAPFLIEYIWRFIESGP